MAPRADELADLRRSIEASFARRPYPGDDRIADSDARYEDYEGHVVARFHRGKIWQEITLQHLRDDYEGDASACLAFMTPEGFRYFLPAYVLIALEPDADALGDAVVGALTHPGARRESYARVADDLGLARDAVFAAQEKRFLDRLSGLDADELGAVRATLGHLARLSDAESARLGAALPNDARAALTSWGEGSSEGLSDS